MTEINLDDYVLESKTELGELAAAIREKSGATGSLSVKQMTEQTAGLYPTSVLESLINRKITEIVIPSGVTYIGQYAFMRCNSLKNVVLPEGLERISEYGFSLCNSLKKMNLPHGLKLISFAAFQNTPLEEVSLPTTLESIGQFVFYGTNLTSIALPNSITSMNLSVFNESKKLTTIYCDWVEGEKPDIEANAPWGATNADVVYLHKGCTEGVQLALNDEGTAYTVTGYSGTSTDVVISAYHDGIPIKEIEDNALSNTLIKHLTIGDNVTWIRNSAVSLSTVLESVTIGNGVTSIGNYAFAECAKLATVTIKSNKVFYMGSYVFDECDNLTDIYVPWSEGKVKGAPWGAENATIHYDISASGEIVDKPDDWT